MRRLSPLVPLAPESRITRTDRMSSSQPPASLRRTTNHRRYEIQGQRPSTRPLPPANKPRERKTRPRDRLAKIKSISPPRLSGWGCYPHGGCVALAGLFVQPQIAMPITVSACAIKVLILRRVSHSRPYLDVAPSPLPFGYLSSDILACDHHEEGSC